MNDFNSAVVLLSVAGAIILLLISAIGYFLKPLLNAIEQLKEAINDLKLIVEIQKTEAKSFSKFCDLRHLDLDKRLKEIENHNK